MSDRLTRRTERVSLRVPFELAARVRALAPVVIPRGLPATASDAYLLLITRGAEVLEEKARARGVIAAPRTPCCSRCGTDIGVTETGPDGPVCTTCACYLAEEGA